MVVEKWHIFPNQIINISVDFHKNVLNLNEYVHSRRRHTFQSAQRLLCCYHSWNTISEENKKKSILANLSEGFLYLIRSTWNNMCNDILLYSREFCVMLLSLSDVTINRYNRLSFLLFPYSHGCRYRAPSTWQVNYFTSFLRHLERTYCLLPSIPKNHIPTSHFFQRKLRERQYLNTLLYYFVQYHTLMLWTEGYFNRNSM